LTSFFNGLAGFFDGLSDGADAPGKVQSHNTYRDG
jgi:hypothetical protein